MDTSNGRDVSMASPDLLPQSDDELFNPSYKQTYETVETVPLNRVEQDDENESEQETMATLPQHRYGTQLGNTDRFTQPTQIIRRSSPLISSSPSSSAVQVAASSPISTPLPVRKPSILASAMAPAGTAYRRPFLPPPPRQIITIKSDDEGPTYLGDSSDEDKDALKRNNIKTTNFRRSNPSSAEKVPESPAKGAALFKNFTSSFAYNASNAVKRSADTSANAYGNAYKRPRQTGPSRAMPVAQEQQPDMEIDDISDYNIRQKVKRMWSTLSTSTVRECYETLMEKKGIYDDAVDHLLLKSEKWDRQHKKAAIDLTGSDDELMPTPAGPRKQLVNQARQQAKVPQKTIAEKWSSTQNARKLASKPLNVFEEPPKKTRTLMRGRKDRSSPGLSPVQIFSDNSDEADSGVHSGPDDKTLEARVLTFFNTATAADLMDTAGMKRDLAEHFVSQRPFRSVAAVRNVETPDLKTAKGKRKTAPVGERMADKVEEMIESYEAVDYLVKKCEDTAKPLVAEMKKWGIDIYGSKTGELDIVSLQNSQKSSHDSGIGTPVSDDDRDNIRRPSSKKYISPPPTMSTELQMKDYQIVGMNWMYLLYKKNLSCILADDMGLGKTCQVIAFLAHLRETGENGPHLVVVPAATLENWLKEFQKFCPSLTVEPYYSTNPSERQLLRANIDADRDDINVIVTTYTLAKGKEDNPWLRKFGFTCTIFDEGHILKNAAADVHRKLVQIGSKFRLLLTGTPLQNNLRELISLLSFLMPPLFREKAEELQAIFNHNVKALDENHEALLSAQRIARARLMLTPFVLRRKKFQVLKDLPNKERRVEYCDLTPEQAEIYQMWIEKAYSVRERRARGENMGSETANILMRLRQAAIHPFLFRRIYRDKQLPLIAKQCLKDELWASSNPSLIVTELTQYSDMEIHKLCDEHHVLQKFALNDQEWLASGKIQKMLELLRKFIAEGHRTLIFSQFVMVLDILELVLEREAIAYFRLDGSTKVSERQDLIDEFCDDENRTPVFMLSTRAGGAGINLAKANKVIVFDSGFNPQDDIQAENRAHRIGQVKEVEVVRLVTKGTVEEQIYAMGLTKLKLDEQVAGDGAEENVVMKEGELTEKEVEGKNMVEEMFFKKLEEKGTNEVRKEIEDNVVKEEVSELKDSDSQKTIKAEKLVSDQDQDWAKAKAEQGAATINIEDENTKPCGPEPVKEEDSVRTRKQSVDLPSRPRRTKVSAVKSKR